MRTTAAVIAAALLGWFAHDFTVEEAPAAVKSIRSADGGRAAARPSTLPITERVGQVEIRHGSLGNRNLFAYREPAAAPAFLVGEEPRRVVAVAPPAVAVIETPGEPQPQFPYRFIGTFGTRERRLAAFSRDGEVIAVRAGAKIGSDFVLRSIGLESVEVQPLAPASAAQQIALGR